MTDITDKINTIQEYQFLEEKIIMADPMIMWTSTEI